VPRLVAASSSSVYGDAPVHPTTEESITRPVSPYGVTKLASEHLCLAYGRPGVAALSVTTLRYFTVYGPRQRPDMAFHRFLKAVRDDQPITLYGDGEQTRDFTYVANVVDGVLRACEAPKAAGEAINVACGTRISLNELLRVMNTIVGTNIQAIYKDSRAGDVKDSQADITKANELLGYTPIVALDEGLKHTLDWCRAESGAPANR
jgi:UDP-glucose 4-epimerase